MSDHTGQDGLPGAGRSEASRPATLPGPLGEQLAEEAGGPEPSLDSVLEQLEALEQGLGSLEIDPLLAGESGQAQENRAIRIAGARSAARRAEDMRIEVEQVRAGVRAFLAQPRERADARAQHARARAERDQPDPAEHLRRACDHRIADALAASVRELALQPSDEGDVLDRVVTAARAAIPQARHAGVCEARPRAPIGPMSASDPRLLDAIRTQVEHEEGAAHEALSTGETVLVRTAAEMRRRWPSIAPRYESLGVRSVLATPMIGSARRPCGVVEFCADRDDAFDDAARLIAQVFAAHAAQVTNACDQLRGLERALQNRDLIGQAKGVLMVRHQIEAEKAFTMLVEASQHSNIKLVEVARYVTTTMLDPDPGPDADLDPSS